jgi:hypothetical protein
MIRVLLKLAAIFVLMTAGVHFGYRQLEERLLSDVCKPMRGKTSKQTQQETAARPDAQPEVEPTAAAQDFQIIVRRNIFQTASAAGKMPQEEAAPPPTSLNLALIGTVTGLEQSGSWAVVADNAKRKQQIVREGQQIKGTAAAVKTIAWNKVTLEVNGRTEVLEMPKLKSGRPGIPAGRELNRIEPPSPEPVEAVAEEPPVPEPPSRPPALRPHRRINLPPPAPEGEVEVIEEETHEETELPALEDEDPSPSEEEVPLEE